MDTAPRPPACLTAAEFIGEGLALVTRLNLAADLYAAQESLAEQPRPRLLARIDARFTKRAGVHQMFRHDLGRRPRSVIACWTRDTLAGEIERGPNRLVPEIFPVSRERWTETEILLVCNVDPPTEGPALQFQAFVY